MQLIQILYPSILILILLVYMHSIFGIEIIKRKVIFTDLAVGQMAAIGMAISIGFFHGNHQVPLTLVFALFGSILIAYMYKKTEHTEAFIGSLYALGASFIMILLASSPNGTELFLKLSATDILFTSLESVYITFILYTVVGLIMFLYYPKNRWN